MKAIVYLFRLSITYITIFFSVISYSQTNRKEEASSYMDYLPQHLSHLDTYTWDKIQRGVLIRIPGNPPFPNEMINIIGENCIYIHFHSDLPENSRADFTTLFPNRIYRLAYKNLTKHYAGTDLIFNNVPQWFIHKEGGTPNIYQDDHNYPYYNLLNTNTLHEGMSLQQWWINDLRKETSVPLPGNAIFIDNLQMAILIAKGRADNYTAKYDYYGNDVSDIPFIDHDENYIKPLLARIRDEFAQEMIVTGNFFNAQYGPDYVMDYLHCNYIEHFERFGDDYTHFLNIYIENYIAVSQAGKMTYFNMAYQKPTPTQELSIEQMRIKALNAMPEFYNALPNQIEKDDLAEMYAYFEFKLAIFLLGANEYSYLGYQKTVLANEAGINLFKAIPPFPEFQYPLGEPLGPALREGNIWTRYFEFATVWLDSEQGIAQINWNKTLSIESSFNLEEEAFRIIPNIIQNNSREITIEGIPINQKDIKVINLNGQVVCSDFLLVNTYCGRNGRYYNRWKLSKNHCFINKGIYIIKSNHLAGYLIVN